VVATVAQIRGGEEERRRWGRRSGGGGGTRRGGVAAAGERDYERAGEACSPQHPGTSAAAAASPRASPAATGVAAWGGDDGGWVRAETRLSSRGEKKTPETEIFTATVASRVR
jgi:erythromycin esterase-like protein